jgi:PIN domain nuclease of toxin-antitoxin system
LADTHIVVRWLATPRKLSREQSRALDEAVRRREPIAMSDVTLMEIAILSGMPGAKQEVSPNEILKILDASQNFQILPITMDVANEIAAIGDSLRDPFDRIIVCTARVHRLRLLTAEERIIESRLVPVID